MVCGVRSASFFPGFGKCVCGSGGICHTFCEYAPWHPAVLRSCAGAGGPFSAGAEKEIPCALCPVYFLLQYDCEQYLPLQLADTDGKHYRADGRRGRLFRVTERVFFGASGMVLSYPGLGDRK